MEGPGLGFQGAGGQPDSASCFCKYVIEKRAVLASGLPLPLDFSGPLGGVVRVFSLPSLVVWDSPKGTTGEMFQGPNGPSVLARRMRG